VADLKEEFARLCAIVAQLRAPGGCPWDREQTHASLAPPLIEETYEVVSAIRAADDANLREELGDVLLLVVMHAEIARESGRFEIGDLIAQVTEKLIRRHPHVFGTSDVKESDAVVRQWETIKRDEKKTTSDHYLDDLPAAFPALMRAQKAQKKAARVHFDWSNVGDVLAKVDEEFGEAKKAIGSGDEGAIGDEIGDLLFAVTNLARKCKLEAESTLQAATEKFIARFNALEDRVRGRGKKLGDLQLEELDQIWNELKLATGRVRPDGGQTSNAQR
jgi:MazG family protein